MPDRCNRALVRATNPRLTAAPELGSALSRQGSLSRIGRGLPPDNCDTVMSSPTYLGSGTNTRADRTEHPYNNRCHRKASDPEWAGRLERAKARVFACGACDYRMHRPVAVLANPQVQVTATTSGQGVLSNHAPHLRSSVTARAMFPGCSPKEDHRITCAMIESHTLAITRRTVAKPKPQGAPPWPSPHTPPSATG